MEGEIGASSSSSLTTKWRSREAGTRATGADFEAAWADADGAGGGTLAAGAAGREREAGTRGAGAACADAGGAGDGALAAGTAERGVSASC